MPPGPAGWPVIGNILDMPSSHEWRTFAQWGETWGDIISVNLLGKPLVILNSSHVADEMLDKKSLIYSGRPVFPVCGEVIGWNRILAFHQYGPRWREIRRLFSQTVGSHNSLAQLTDDLEREADGFLGRVMANPTTLTQQVHRFTGASILKVTYGYTIEKENDELLRIVDTAMEQFSLASAPGAYLADAFSILTHVPPWFPGAGWKTTAQAWRKDLEKMCDIPYNFTKAQMRAGTASSSLVAINLEGDIDPQREAIIKDAASSLYAGGADTSVSAIRSFFLAMMRFPEAQRKAQAEIDRVIGSDRLPTVADREQLPYVRALCWEVLRWQPIAPLGIPHYLTQDDVHAGYFLPKGTVVIANIWKMLRDPKRYARPQDFNPDRFVPGQGAEPEYDPRQVVFGFGRRVCPGSQLAEMSLFLICAVSLAAFDISKPIVDGKAVEPSMEYTTGTISHPCEFQCSIKPRSAKVQALLSSSGDVRY
ncbi:cytochrome P450 [Fomitopsis serialis]|uniref:cytochrome P450 n=1 Tax=Fomitopsis serialis TaxID=139415 RepID=UPI0020076237|nr:cytochrome P450 [Neoantrodia serialis]KAH9917582.1 cytochrome P450 [Neoantrodia serialis]